jgi:hypothetical protein
VTDAIEPGQLFDVHVDHVARPCPLVSPHRHRWLQVFQAPQTHGIESGADCGKRKGQQAGDAPEGAALMAQGNGTLQMLWIERPPLAAANTASIHQGGGTTAAVTAQPLVGRAQADSSLRGEMGQGLGVLNVSAHKQFPTDGRQSGVGVGMHGV